MSPIRTKTVVFHVGAHKTGTSLVQNYLRDNTTVLRRHRMYYIHRSGMNTYVGWGDKLLAAPDALADKIRRPFTIPWFNVVIASHENTLGRPFAEGGAHLYPRAPEIIPALGQVLRPYRAKVFFSIRPQEQFLESYYLQMIHQGGYEPFEQWLEGIDLETLSWRPVVDALLATFGPEQVEIVDFREIHRGQQAYVEDFFRRIDRRYTFPVELPDVRNPSISEKGLRLALTANPHLESAEERKLMRKFLQGNFSNVDYPRARLLTDEQQQWLRERYAGEYETLVAPGTNQPDATVDA